VDIFFDEFIWLTTTLTTNTPIHSRDLVFKKLFQLLVLFLDIRVETYFVYLTCYLFFVNLFNPAR
jgi:hypothetical protein